MAQVRTNTNNKKSVSRKPQEVNASFSKRTLSSNRTVKNVLSDYTDSLKVKQSVRTQKQTLHKKEVAKNGTKKLLVKKVKRSMKKGLKVVLLSPAFHTFFRVGTTAIVAIVLLYSSYTYISKSFANEIIVSQSEILSRVGQLTEIPNEEPDQIVRVQDESVLRHQNPFYQDVKEGDYIIMYKRVAIIYDLRNDVIVALKRTK